MIRLVHIYNRLSPLNFFVSFLQLVFAENKAMTRQDRMERIGKYTTGVGRVVRRGRIHGRGFLLTVPDRQELARIQVRCELEGSQRVSCRNSNACSVNRREDPAAVNEGLLIGLAPFERYKKVGLILDNRATKGAAVLFAVVG